MPTHSPIADVVPHGAAPGLHTREGNKNELELHVYISPTMSIGYHKDLLELIMFDCPHHTQLPLALAQVSIIRVWRDWCIFGCQLTDSDEDAHRNSILGLVHTIDACAAMPMSPVPRRVVTVVAGTNPGDTPVLLRACRGTTHCLLCTRLARAITRNRRFKKLELQTEISRLAGKRRAELARTHADNCRFG